MDATPYTTPKLKLLPLREQPAYRVAQDADACNLAELLAVLVGGPNQIEIAEALLAQFGSLHRIQQAHQSEIAGIPGVGPKTAARLKAALALARKALQESAEERPRIGSPDDAAALLQYEMGLLEREQLRVLLLDARNRLIEMVILYQGSVNSAHVRVAEVFQAAIQRNARSILLAHNHPSSDLSPSPEDIALTRAVVQAGNLLDISVVDHLVIGKSGFVSLRERGLGFS
jgi:DNA repair protein RadC